jgi:hypothetical protein
MKDGKLANKDILQKVKKAEANGNYRFSKHAEKRLQERKISIQEVRQILKSCRREHTYDEYNPEFDNWNYAIQGKSLDGRTIRVAIAIVSPGILIITVINIR